jgi:hypothetical protein
MRRRAATDEDRNGGRNRCCDLHVGCGSSTVQICSAGPVSRARRS